LELIEFLSGTEDGACIEPRGFAKSTWEKIDSLHDIVYELEPVIVYGSDSMSAAQMQLEGIKGELENNTRLRQVYGDLVPPESNIGRKWTNTHFETTNGINMVARGRGKGRGINIRNQRPTKIILDDVETDESVHSTEQRRKTHDWVYNVIIPSLDRERGRLKMIGTVIHPQCEVLAFYKAKGGVFRRAIENGESIWPAYWPLEALYRLRDGYTKETGEIVAGIGTRSFSQEYLNEPINDDTAIFKREWLETNTYRDFPKLEDLDIKMCADPQSGESQMADFLGICVMGQHKITRKRYVLHAEKFKGPINEQLDRLRALFTKWNPIVIGIEKIMAQTALYQLAVAPATIKPGELEPPPTLRVMAVDPKQKDKVDRAKYVEPLVQQGVILFHPAHVDLYNEMIQFPNGDHDDIVDAFLYVNSLFEQSSVSFEQKDSPMITAGLMKRKF